MLASGRASRSVCFVNAKSLNERLPGIDRITGIVLVHALHNPVLPNSAPFQLVLRYPFKTLKN
jgi:hypothetical protein